MVDAHAHLDKYGPDLPRALDQIRSLSLRTIAVSMDIASFRETQRIAATEPLVLPSFGIHPWEAARFAADLAALEAPLADARLIGEIGLDHYFVKDPALHPAQNVVFEFFLEEAERSGRLVNLHTTGAEAEVLESLGRRTLPAVIVHWYSGPMALVDPFLDIGAYFTVGVEVLRSERIQALAAALPLDRILTETDNPGGWQWMTEEVGFPDLIERVEDSVAGIRGIPRAVFSAAVQQNFERVLDAGGMTPGPK